MLGFVILGLLGFAALVFVYMRTEIPQPNADAAKQVSIVYYNDGKTELDRFSSVNREDVELAKVPLHVQRAFLAAEDRKFYTNNGVSATGIVRAFWTNLRGGQQQGGSTITQQYVKNYFLTQDRTVSRKLKEVMISIKIDRKYTKDEILKNYLNNIFFGRNSYGIQSASTVYFDKDVSKLTPAEGAFLASVINAPGIYDPANGERAKAAVRGRMDYVLNGMVDMGWMTQQAKDQIRFPAVQPRKAPTYGSGPTGYITASVRNELKSTLKLSDEDIDRGGLRITTTIDKNAQDAAVRAVEDNVPAVSSIPLRAGLVSQKPDGSVVAMYGGKDYRKNNYNSATQAAPQGGSSYKAFGLVGALENGYSLNSRFDGNSPVKLPGLDKPLQNNLGVSYGSVDLSFMMKKSVNTAFLRLNMEMGPAKTRAAAIKAGIPQTSPGLADDTTNILGTASTRVIDMARAYSTISSEGKRATPYFISKVASVTGDYSYAAEPKTEQTIDKDVAADVVNAMAGVNEAGGTGYPSLQGAGFTRPSGGKTGTTDEFKAAWYSGFTPNQLTTSVGMYAGDGTDSLREAAGAEFYGGAVPATIWAEYMNAALKGQPVAKLPEPGNVKGKQPATEYVPPPATTRRPTATSSRPAPPATTTTTTTTTSSPTLSPTSSPTSTPSSSPPSTTTSSSTSTTTAPTTTSAPPSTTQPSVPTSTTRPPATTTVPQPTAPAAQPTAPAAPAAAPASVPAP